jgi:cytochrome c-type protein NapB
MGSEEHNDPQKYLARPNSRSLKQPGPLDPVMRVVQLFLAGVIGLAFVGFVVGIRQGAPAPEPKPVIRDAPEVHPDAIPATAYRDFDRRWLGPNREWKTTLASLEQPSLDLFTKPERSEAALHEVLVARAGRRAFDGAPPVVPHPIDQLSTASCLACHGDAIAIGSSPDGIVRATKISHGMLSNCTQCHIEQQAAQLEKTQQQQNTFVGRPAPLRGRRAWNGAPPTVPHTVFMRETCLSCHGPASAEPIRTTHAWRTNCLQCHAPSAILDQMADNDRFSWPAAPLVDGANSISGSQP